MDIKINEVETLGLISFNVSKDDEGNLIKSGVLKTHLYIEEINTLECDRFRLTGVDVISESFGSNDPCIIYQFVFEEYECDYSEVECDIYSLYKGDD